MAILGDDHDDDRNEEDEDDIDHHHHHNDRLVEDSTDLREEGEAKGLPSIQTVPVTSLAWIDAIYDPNDIPWKQLYISFSHHFVPAFAFGASQGLGFYTACRLFRLFILPSIFGIRLK